MKHEYYKCPSDCFGCMFCDGGIEYCNVCKCGEAELADECPGPPVKKPHAYVSHPESDSAFPVYSEDELHRCLDDGLCMEVSEYVCAMIEIGLADSIDWDWDFKNNSVEIVEL